MEKLKIGAQGRNLGDYFESYREVGNVMNILYNDANNILGRARTRLR